MEHPLASCVGHFVVASAGGMAATLLLGNKSMLLSITLPNVMASVIVWWVLHCLFDHVAIRYTVGPQINNFVGFVVIHDI